MLACGLEVESPRGEDLSPEIFFRLNLDGERNMEVPDNDPAGLAYLTTPSSKGPGCALWYTWGGRSQSYQCGRYFRFLGGEFVSA